MKIYCSWESLKQIKEDKQLSLYYYEYDNYYEIILVDGDTVWFSKIWTNTNTIQGIDITQNNNDRDDFVNNYKAGSQKL